MPSKRKSGRKSRGRPRKPGAAESSWTYSSTISILIEKRPEMAAEPPRIQAGLAILVERCDLVRRPHKSKAGYATMSFKEIARWVGRKKFEVLNSKYLLLETDNSWSHGEKVTKGWRRLPDIEAALTKVVSVNEAPPLQIIRADGLTMRKPPAAIAAKDSFGFTRKAWKGVTLKPLVPVNVESLKAYDHHLSQQLDNPMARQRIETQRSGRTVERLKRIRGDVRRILRATSVEITGGHAVISRYVESKTGRLTGRGDHLQGCAREARDAALVGTYDYDMENCHPTIIVQLARRAGIDLPMASYYLLNKKQVRDGIAERVGIGSDEAKKCILAAFYGTPKSNNRRMKITKDLGKFKARQLFDDPQFAKIMSEVLIARRRILAMHDYRPKRGRVVSVVGKSCDASLPPRKRLAHIVQGIEVALMRSIILRHPEHIDLVIHDGFTSHQSIETSELTAIGYEATGFSVSWTRRMIPTPFPFQNAAAAAHSLTSSKQV